MKARCSKRQEVETQHKREKKGKDFRGAVAQEQVGTMTLPLRGIVKKGNNYRGEEIARRSGYKDASFTGIIMKFENRCQEKFQKS